MSGPLKGVRVVELAGLGPVPFAGMVLADLGADVIRVDRLDPGPVATLFSADPTARGRRSIALDLKQAPAVEVALRLVETAEILVEGFRPGVTERLGLGPRACLERNPALVYGRMTGWGQTGPLAPTAGHDINYLAIAGTLSAIGPVDQPLPPLNLVADYGGGAMLLLVGILSALTHARATGQGQVVDAAMVDGASLLASIVRGALASGMWTDRRQSNLLDGGAPFYRTYRTGDGGFVAVGALEPQFFAALLNGLELEADRLPAQYDRSGWPFLQRAIEERFAAYPRSHWEAIFAGTDACVTPVLSWAESAANEHLLARSTLIEVAGVRQPAPAPRFSATPAGMPVPAGPAGLDTELILGSLGYSQADLSKLKAEKAVG
jgi:alpha-methylacyl-CoA racemase